jgi:large repetitive protein
MSDGLGNEILDLGKAIGLFDDGGGLQPHWFENPLNHIESIFTVDTQRAAFLRVLDALLAPVQLPGLPAGETWHPLFGEQTLGNAYLTVNVSNGVTFGFAGELHSSDGPPSLASLKAHLPLVSFNGGNVTAVAGSSSGPLDLSLRVHLGLTFPGDPIGLDSVVVTASLAPLGGNPPATLTVELEGLQLDDTGPKNITLDPSNLESEAVHLIIGFIQEQLKRLAASTGEAGAVTAHLLQLLGFGDASIPQFPFTQLADPSAINNWFASLLQGGASAPVVNWLGHLVGLIGAGTVTVTGSGTEADPWVAPVFAIGTATGSGLNITFATKTVSSTTSLLMGLQARVIPSGANPPVRIEGSATLASIPITGTGSAAVLPSASVTAFAPGAIGAGPLVSTGTVSVQSLRAGFSWNGSTLQPLLELDTVDFTLLGTPTHYDKVDLTNADSVASDVSALVGNTIVGYFGNSSPGRNLAALIGIVSPANDPGTTHHLDFTQLVSNPAGAIGGLHRAVLLDNAHPWSHMLEEIGGLVGINTAVTGSGTRTDPWVLELAPPSTFHIEIAAWNDQTSGVATDPQQLRIGLRASISQPPAQIYWLAELLAFDLPAAGKGHIGLMAGQHAHIGVQPIPTIPSVAGLTLSIGDFAAEMTFIPGTPLAWSAGLHNISLTFDGTTINIPSIGFPFAAPFDVTNPAAIAADFGITIPNLELLLRMVLARALASWGGMPAFTLAGLLGVHGSLDGLSADWPALADPGAAGSLLSDPFTALRNWLASIATGVSADGKAFLPQILPWLRGLLSDALPDTPGNPLSGFSLPVSGSGTYEDPWALPLTTSSTANLDALVWLEPAGPPPNWATPLIAAATGAANFSTLMQVAQDVAAFVPGLNSSLVNNDAGLLSSALSSLSSFFAGGDGVVPLASQVPTSPNWTAGTTLSSAHPAQPTDPPAISQILAQVDSLAGGAGSARTVLLLGPAFSDHTIWDALLADPNVHGTKAPNTSFNLRVPGLDPSAVDLTTVTAQASWYTADLSDDGTGNVTSLTAQIGRLVARVQRLNGTTPVTLVAHSTAGVAALAFTAANPTLVQGLVTLGTPHLGSSLPFLSNSRIGDALRVLQLLRPQLAAGAIRDAFDFLVLALDGYKPPASVGALATAAPFPAGSFPVPITAPASIATGGRPVLAIGSQLGGGLLDALKPALSAIANSAANPVTAPPAPTHIAFGARAHINLATSAAGNVAVDTTVRADLFQLPLHSGAATPPHPAHALKVRATLTNPNGWLVGASSSFAGAGLPPVDVRVRWAEIGADIYTSSSTFRVDPIINLHQVSWHGPVIDLSSFTDANAQALLGAVSQTISNPAPASTSPAGILLSTLQAIKVAVVDSHGGIGISADAFSAIAADAAGYLSTQLNAALNAATSFAGFTATTVVIPSRGITAVPEWLLPISGLPLEIYLLSNPWAIGLRTKSTGSGSSGWSIAKNTSITLDASVAIPSFTPTLDATFTLGAFSLSWTSSSNQLTASAQPWLAPITPLPPPSASTLQAALSDALPRMLFSGAASAVLEALAGPGITIGPIDTFFTSMKSVLTQANALGNIAGTGLDAAKLTKLLQFIGNIAGLPPGPGLSLPGNLQITASGAGTDADPVKVQLATTAAIGGVLNLTGGVSFDKLIHPSPTGTVSFTIPLPAAVAGAWSSITVNFGASAAGVTLSIAPVSVPPTPAIQILPTFSGLGALAGAAEALLPQVLDAVVTAIGPSTVMTLTLDVAAALGIYDTVNGFKTHGDDLKAMLNGSWLSGFTVAQRGSIATAIAGVFSGGSPLAGILPGSVSAGSGGTAGVVTWALPLSGSDSGTITVALGWDATGPTAAVGLADFKLADGALGITAAGGYAAGSITVAAALGVHLQQAIGIDVTPTLSFTESGGTFQLELYPLATGSGGTFTTGPITIDFIPPAVHMAADGPVALIEQFLIPLVGNTVLATNAIKNTFSTHLWSGGPTVQDVLTGSEIAVPSGGSLVINPSFPSITTLVSGVLSALSSGVNIKIADNLFVGLTNNGGKLGVNIKGSIDFPVGDFDLSMLFGAPAFGSGFDAGATLYLFDVAGGNFTFDPGLQAIGLGVGLAGANDSPLVNTNGFRIGGVKLYSFFFADFSSGFSLSGFGAGAEIDKLGIPLSQATGGNVGGNNPVAAGLLGGGGDGGNGGGDTQAPNPAVDVEAWYWEQSNDPHAPPTPAADGQFHIKFSGNDQPIWIGVHAQLGPIYLDQIGIILNGNTSASLVLDATVKVGPLTGQVDELGVTIPFNAVLDPSRWSLDLKGLALSFQTPGVTIAGALLKNDSGPAIEYDGMLLIQITEFGLVAVGAYSKPKDAQGDYTSVFIFAGLFIIIGIPPIIEIEAIGLGVGYNRELIVPDDMNKIPSFILVAALDDGGALANDPMGALLQIRDSIPAKRGSMWLAVGLHGTTFVIVHVTAIVYVALDRGVEIGIIGVARMAIPSDDTALVSVELALKARFSSAEGILSIQAQLTDNSYIFDKDCQLTGGFAYFMWFPEGQFVLTIGGYNPHFQKPTQFPDVPRLGFRWGLPIGATIKGENYFALTNTCIMAGGRLELTYGISCAYVWFTAFANFLISWDPFYYEIDIGVSVGATFSIQVCFWGFCVGVSVTVSLGATLTIEGPPLHGTCTVDLAICSVTVAFGPSANPQPPYITDFNVFAMKYLYGNDPNGNAFRVNVLSGLVPPSPSGAAPAPGTADKPWKMLSEFSFQCDTKMPATITNDFVFGDQDQGGKVHSIDLAPMNKESVDTKMVVTLFGNDGGTWTPISVQSPNPNPDFQIDTVHWIMTPIIGKVSEATWHWNDPSNMPAAANTVPAVVGLTIQGFCFYEGRSALIPIAKLYDTGNSRPLPFATDFTLTYPQYQAYGLAAVQLAELTAKSGSASTLLIASAITTGDTGFFADQRTTAGLPTAGNSPVANRALLNYRSSPPLVVPITTGLTMKPPALPAPPVINRPPVILPVALEQPRLRAVLRGLPQVVSDVPTKLRTTVNSVTAAKGIARMAAPLANAPGSNLIRVKAPIAPAPTKIARAGSTLRSAELGWTSGTGHQQQLNDAVASFKGNGLTIPAGTTHIWDVPAGSQDELIVSGDSAFRVTFLTRGGSVLGDREYPPTAPSNTAPLITIALPAKCGMVSIECLGKLPAGSLAVTPGFAAVAFSAAPAGRRTVAGWQAGNLLPQVGPTTILGRGACLMLPQTHIPLRNRQAISQTMVRVTDAVADQIGTETWLPTSVGVVMILLDLQDATATANGDLALSVKDATLSSAPIRILGGRRRALLYDVSGVDPKADHITVGAGSSTGWRLAGVVGMPGKAQEWATDLQGKVPEHIVPDGPLTPDGSVSVRLVASPATPTNKLALTGAQK